MCLCKHRNIADKICHFFFFARLRFSVFQMFCSEHIFLFLVKIKKTANAHFQKEAVPSCGWLQPGSHILLPHPVPKQWDSPAPQRACPPEVGVGLRASSPTPAAEGEVSACGFPVREPTEWKEMSLKYLEGRPEQMLFRVQMLLAQRVQILLPQRPQLRRVGKNGRPEFCALRRGHRAREGSSRLELCPSPRSLGVLDSLLAHPQVPGGQHGVQLAVTLPEKY